MDTRDDREQRKKKINHDEELTNSLLSNLLQPTEFLSMDNIDLEKLSGEGAFSGDFLSHDEDFDFDFDLDDEENEYDDEYYEDDDEYYDDDEYEEDSRPLPFKVRNAVAGTGIGTTRAERAKLVSQYNDIMTTEDEPEEESTGFWSKIKSKFKKRDNDEHYDEDEYYVDENDVRHMYSEEDEDEYYDENDDEYYDDDLEYDEFQNLSDNDDTDFGVTRPQPQVTVRRNGPTLHKMEDTLEDEEFYNDDENSASPGTAEFNLEEYRKQEYITNEMLLNSSVRHEISQPNSSGPKNRNLLAKDDEEIGNFRAKETSHVEYTDIAQKTTRRSWINENLRSSSTKHRILLVLTFIAALITIPIYSEKLLKFNIINPVVSPKPFIWVNVVLLMIAVLVMAEQIKNGIVGIFKGKPNVYTTIAIASIISFIQQFMLLANPAGLADANVNLYTFPIVVSLLFQNYGILVKWKYTKSNFNVISEDKEYHAIEFLEEDRFKSQMISLTGNPDTLILGEKPTKFYERFFEYSLHEDETQFVEGENRGFFGIGLIASVVIFFISIVMARPLIVSMSLLICMLSVMSLFSYELAKSLPLLKIAKTLNPKNAFISSTNAIHDIGDISSVIVHTKDLFPTGTITLNGIRAFKGARIDEAIIDAGSVLYHTDDALAPLFLNIIKGKTGLLKELDSAEYEEGLGICAWADDKRILVGSSELMRKYNIATPSEEYEDKYKATGGDLVYVASAGVLSAMFIVQYHALPEIKERIQEIVNSGVDIIVETSDQNLSSKRLSVLYDVPIDHIYLMPEKSVPLYENITKKTPSAKALAGHNKNICGYLGIVVASLKITPLLSASKFIQILTTVFGIIVTVFLGLFGKVFPSVGQLTPVSIVLFHTISLIIIHLIIKMKKI